MIFPIERDRSYVVGFFAPWSPWVERELSSGEGHRAAARLSLPPPTEPGQVLVQPRSLDAEPWAEGIYRIIVRESAHGRIVVDRYARADTSLDLPAGSYELEVWTNDRLCGLESDEPIEWLLGQAEVIVTAGGSIAVEVPLRDD